MERKIATGAFPNATMLYWQATCIPKIADIDIKIRRAQAVYASSPASFVKIPASSSFPNIQNAHIRTEPTVQENRTMRKVSFTRPAFPAPAL